MNIRQLSTTAVIAALVSLAGLGNHAQAHDTDVYLNPGGGSGGEPMVMFMLDWNPSLGSTAYSTLPTDPENGVRKLYDAGYLTKDTNIEAFDVFVAVLKQVLDPLHGVKVGVMISHNEKPSCKDYGPAAEGVCSRGAYMLAGLESVTAGDDDQTIAEAGYVGEDAHKKMIFEKLDAMPAPSGNTSHPFQGISLYFELFRYLTGQGIWNAHNGQTDYDTTDAENLDANIDISSDTGLDVDGDNTQALLMWDTGIEDVAPNKGKYISPLDIAAGHCSKIYVVNLIKDYGGENVKPWSDTINAAKNVGGMTTAVNVQSNAGWVNMIDWLHSVDLADGTWGRATELEGKQNITSYFVAKNTGQLTGAAEAGGTGVPIGFTTDKPGELRDKLNALFGQILSVSTSYTAPSVAVNVYNRAQVESDVFLAMFRAEETPLWPGNVKKFELGDLDFSYVDADGETITETVTTLLDNSNPQRDAVNHLDGRIDKDALSFWTIAGDLPDPVGEDEFEPGKDGRFVERGGCGSRIPGFKLTASYNPGFSNGGETTEIGPRKLFTQPLTVPTDGVPVALRALNAVDTIESDILTALGPMIAGTGAGDCTTPYVDTSGDGSEPDDITGCGMLRYARGINDDGSNRSWMFADALHSRPLAVNYGNEGDHNDADHPNIRIFVGSNDGYMHMIRNTTAAGVEEGIEGWAFMPKETMGILLDFKTSPTAPHPYGVDGAPTAYMIDTDGDGNIESGDGDRVILYFGLRRGGRAYYALDVTDPDDPKMLWQITGGIADTAFEELGQSWSTPKIGRMYVDGIVDDVLQDPIPVVFFAGGYDENKDTHSDPQHPFATGGNDSMGRAVFIVDALSGEPLWIAQYGASTSTGGSTATTFIGDNRTVPVFSHADMVDSIPSDVTPVDSDNNGLIDRIYVGDTGGRLWRIDTRGIEPADLVTGTLSASDWKITPIMSVGRHHSYAGNNHDDTGDRRFFYAPDYVQAREVRDDGTRVAYDAVVIGTGNRANPLNVPSYNPDGNLEADPPVPYQGQDYFYVLKDKALDSGTPPGSVVTHTALAIADVTDDCLDEGGCSPVPDFDLGWRLALECPWQAEGDKCGEKNLASPFTVEGEIFFTTYQPQAHVIPDYCDSTHIDYDAALAQTDPLCSPCNPSEGIGILYILDLGTGQATRDLDVTSIGLRKDDRYEILNSAGIPSEVVSLGDKVLRPDLEVEDAGDNTGYRTYWFEKEY